MSVFDINTSKRRHDLGCEEERELRDLLTKMMIIVSNGCYRSWKLTEAEEVIIFDAYSDVRYQPVQEVPVLFEMLGEFTLAIDPKNHEMLIEDREDMIDLLESSSFANWHERYQFDVSKSKQLLVRACASTLLSVDKHDFLFRKDYERFDELYYTHHQLWRRKPICDGVFARWRANDPRVDQIHPDVISIENGKIWGRHLIDPDFTTFYRFIAELPSYPLSR